MERKWNFPWKPTYRMYGIMTGCTACHDTMNVRTRAWTYGQCVTGKPYFHLPSHRSCFSYFRVILVKLWLIEDFSQICRTRIFRNIQRHFSIQVSFNSHNAYCYFSHVLHIYFVYRENIHTLQLRRFVLIAHKLCHFEKNTMLNMLTKWHL